MNEAQESLKEAIHELKKLRDFFLAQKSSEKKESVLYLCDRKACERCNPDCHHTRDISHARNFEKNLNDDYEETGRPIVFIHSTILLSKEEIKKLRESVDLQLPTGVVVLPHYAEPIIASMGGIDLALGSDMTSRHPLVEKILESQGLPKDFKFSKEIEEAAERFERGLRSQTGAIDDACN